jgi:hypothetical protein
MTEPEAMEGPGARLSIWREAPSLGARAAAAVGAFSCDAPEDGAALLRRAAEGLRGEGFGAVVGPMDGDTWGRHRLVLESDGRPPFLMEPSNPAHHPAAFETAGWSVIARYASAERSLAGARASNPDPPRLTVRAFDMSDAEAQLRRLHALSLEAFAGNFLYRPIAVDAFLAHYRPILPVLDPELILLAEDAAGELAAFLFGVPDPASGAVIMKTYASRFRGGGSLLADRFAARARERGYQRVIHALFHEDNLSARRSEAAGGRIFRRYALWGLEL